MDVKPIHTKKDHKAALKAIEKLWDAEAGTPEHDTLELLGILVDDFEQKNFPIDAPDPVEAVLFHLEQNALEKSALSTLLGSRSRASEFLNRKTGLSLPQIRKLNSIWHIPAEILIQPLA